MNKKSKVVTGILSVITSILFVITTVSLVFAFNVNNELNSVKAASVTNNPRKESYVNGILYQLSAEVKGLQKQAFSLAKIRLDEHLSHKDQYKKPLAVVSDIDDTLMDGANYIADIVQRDAAWDNGPWDHFHESVGSTGSLPLPGAVEFCNYAASKGIEMFYITNRVWNGLDLTVKQLKRAGFPNADEAHVQVMNKEFSTNKTERRNNVLKTHEVLLYMGDNIGDFTADFKGELGSVKRSEMALDAKYRDMWGDKWIVLPNATYGDYVSAAWFNNKTADAAQRRKKIKEVLDTYKFTNPKFKEWYNKK